MDCLHHLLILYPPATGAYEIGCLVARRRVRVAVLPPLFARRTVVLVRAENFCHGGVVVGLVLSSRPYQMIKFGTEHVSTVASTISVSVHP